MDLSNAWIPYGGYWCTPFCKWQTSFSNLPPIPFAAEVASGALAARGIPAKTFDGMCLGTTVPSRHSFYGAPWLAGLLGMEEVTGPNLGQACATSVRCLVQGAQELAAKGATCYLAVTCDRTSNGPHIYYPDPAGPGGTGETENWVLDNFGHDPFGKLAMIGTAEKVAAEAGIGREPQDHVALLRYRQYTRALEDDRAFQRRYMVSPVEKKDRKGRVLVSVATDEGVFPTTAEGLARLKPVLPEGTVTFGAQTFPADGNAAMILAGRERARELSRDPGIEIRLLACGQARVGRGMMPTANVPATRRALEAAGLSLREIQAITSHTPFALNDVYFAREMGIDVADMNRYGCSLVWGHPQAPTGMRAIMELIEELVLLGGGRGLFTGCAAGDTAAALVLEVLTH